MHNSFLLYWLEFMEVYMAKSLIPQLDICCVYCVCQCWFRPCCVEDKHVTFSSCTSDIPILVRDEPTSMVESYFHSLLNNLANWDQILCDDWDMQYVLDVAFVMMMVKDHIPNVLNCVYGIIIGL